MNEVAMVNQARALISKRYFDIVTKLSATSQDGFKRERFQIKIKHMVDEISKAQEDLEHEEELVESGEIKSLGEAIDKITQLMLTIERKTQDSQDMIEELGEKEQDWIKTDRSFKQRRIILNYLIKMKLNMTYDVYSDSKLESLIFKQSNQASNTYEALFFMVQHIFSQNRLPGINFISDVNQFLTS